MGINVLIVGSGAREHALTWKALQSPLTDAVYCAPGNAGTAAIAVNAEIEATDVDRIARFVKERSIELTVIGPEAAVAAGLADRLIAEDRLVFGPTKAAGQIESSKAFAKSLMERVGVPTPAFRVFDDPAKAKDYVRGERRAFVVKADGLAQGKGTLVPRDAEETLDCIDTLMLQKTVGSAADRIVLEEKIEGREVSLMALVDGDHVVPLAPACDYKRALDGDKGPNTGGMGGYSPVSFFGSDDVTGAVQTAFKLVVDALRADGSPYRGCLYAGLMVGEAGIQVLEFNARFGDPETQVVLPRLETDLIPLLEAAARGALSNVNPSWSARSSVGVVLASHGYPSAYTSGHPIEGLGKVEPGVFVFHAGTAADPAGYVTSGGRVLTVVGLGDSMTEARERVYRNVDRIQFQGVTYRRDLALRELEAPALP
ncbi:MAG TPA: phosphoribosylamine--glycine ligase [Candidatus Dormibacteraeota bacterium]|nr:phosphoribosylamine--glycine ligase [Candidatus Dormibacteraeota bacterium]